MTLFGHIAGGDLKRNRLIYFCKPAALQAGVDDSLVHGFDWFEAHARGKDAGDRLSRAYQSSLEWVRKLVSVQGLDPIVRIHDVDLTKDLPVFFECHPHLQFKLVFLDCGYYDVVRECIREFWPRLTPGGVMVLDNLNHETAAGETLAVREMLPDRPIRSFGFTFMPTGYIVK